MTKYNKQWYDKQMENPEFRSKRVDNTRQYRKKMKRETYETAIAFIGEIYNADMTVEEAVDKVMAKYKIIERK